MNEIVSTIRYTEAGEYGIESVGYALGQVEMFFTLKGDIVRQRHASYTRESVAAAVDFIDSMTRRQTICPCYWLYFPIHIESWRKKCQTLLRKIKQMDSSAGSQDEVCVKLFGEEMAKLLSNPQNSTMVQMHDLISDLRNSITKLNMVLSNPSDEAMSLLYREVVAYLDETDSLSYEADQEVAKQCSRCKNGRPQAATVESWIERLGKEAEERGLRDYFDMLASADTAEERKLSAMRYIYNEARDAEKVLAPMMVLERYNRYEALLDKVRVVMATTPMAESISEEALDGKEDDAESEVIRQLNTRLKNNVSSGYDAEVVDQIWCALMQDRFFVQKIRSESVNSYDGVNLSVYAKVVGRLCYHGIIKGRQRVISTELFGDIPNCCEDTLRRDIGVGQMLDSISDEVIKDAIDRVARPLRV